MKIPLRFIWADRFSAAAQWILMGAMVITVWLRASILPWTITTVLWILMASVLCWGISLALQKRIPTITPITYVGGALLLQGWIMAFNPVSYYDPLEHLFKPLDHQMLLPGSVDAYSTRLGMYSFTVLFLIFHVTIDCWRNESFRMQVMWTAAVSTGMMALVGILQKAGLGGLLGLTAQNANEFGPFDYHANAGAMMLGCIPLAASLAVGAWVLRKKPIAIITSILTLLIIAGIFSNTARIAVGFLTLLLIGLSIAYFVMIGGVLPGTWFARIMTIVAVIVVVAIGAGITAIVMPKKWHAVADQLTLQNPRILQWKIVGAMSIDSGFFGSGPNTFNITFPVTRHFDPALYPKYVLTWHTPGEQMSIWSHAHSDPLQALVEYGLVGLILWITMGVWTVVAAYKQLYIPGPLQVRFMLLAAFAGWLVIMTYGLVDFPMQVLPLQLYVVVFAGIIWSERMTELERIAADKAFGFQVMLSRGHYNSLNG